MKVRIVDWRGDQNIPKWYLKSAKWNPDDDISELPLGPGYYIIKPDKGKDDWIPVDFDFDTLQWGLTYQQVSDNKFEIYWPAPSEYRLWIYREERIWDQSQWGPIDGTTDPEEGISFWFRSDVDNTPEPEPEDITLPTVDQAERLESTIVDLTALLPSHFDKPRIPTNQQPTSLMGTMAQIAATMTLMSTITWSTGPTVSSRTRAPAGGIWDSIKQDLQSSSSNKGKDPQASGGNGDPGGSGSGGNPGGDPDRDPGGNPGGGGNLGGDPRGEDQTSDHLIRKEPNVFDGD